MEPSARAIARSCKGFLDDDEGMRLYNLARMHARIGPLLEVGSYCGKSAVYLGSGAKEVGGVLVCVDHHRGSEEHQPGEQYHDPELFDADAKRMDSLFALRRTLRLADLEDTTIVLVAESVRAASVCGAGFGLVFIDGGHSRATADGDYAAWSDKVAPGGILAIHDVFFDASEGGQAPREIYERAIASGRFEALPMTKTLGVLRRA